MLKELGISQQFTGAWVVNNKEFVQLCAVPLPLLVRHSETLRNVRYIF
jgi:hypothetical protein